MTFYYLIPYAELTQSMVNKSTSTNKDELIIKTYNNMPYYQLKVEDEIIKKTNIFDDYRQYRQNELKTASPVLVTKKIAAEGLMNDTVSPNSSKDTVYQFSSNKIITGMQFKANSPNFGDKVSFSVLDASDNLINQHIKDWWVSDDLLKIDVPRTLIVTGMKFKVTYTNTYAALTSVKWFLNCRLENP